MSPPALPPPTSRPIKLTNNIKSHSHLWLSQRADITQLVKAPDGDLPQDAAHDLAAAGLREPGGPGGWG